MAFSFQELHAAGPYYVLATILQWEPLIALRTIDRGCTQEPWGIEFTGSSRKLKFFPSVKVGYYLSTRWVYFCGSRRIRTAKANPGGQGPRRFSCAAWLNLRSSPKINMLCTIASKLPLMARRPSARPLELRRLNLLVPLIRSNYPEGGRHVVPFSPTASIHAVDKDPEWSVDAAAGLARGTSIGNHAIHRRGLGPLDKLNVAEWEGREGRIQAEDRGFNLSIGQSRSG
ncbi:uncharacterized protein BO88DRAFT_445504 [Aspergillus vadensis CBS 113365]|uniref:Uncharacterized protein n=1 Tax=Aspergillus vadensis (strain CBS 113365 / IMI 142717 / IBT 24658) TaxID=1448311 RepID=A0A319B378_ASPVC|nr:hypothetical protein BO88DRAFT_445504 [Aspergillus vadensis CBS 113365]PYH66725.1 hypothetical protein BO88DRAFT_445504 [Aspergillus vadensis CBS 113365]